MNLQTFNQDPVRVGGELPDLNTVINNVRLEADGKPVSSVGSSDLYSKISSDIRPVSFEDPSSISLTQTDVPISAIYSKLRDGSYHAKYKNYAGAFDNEDRLAREQGFFEKAGKGIARFGSKVGIYALDATIGTATGIIQAINDRSLSSLWDNDFSNRMDDWNTKLENNLPIFYTNEYASKNIIGQMFDSPMTFLFKDVADGLAFVGGALLPEAVLAAATGGASLPTTAARLSARFGLKGATNLAKAETRNAGKAFLRQSALDKYLAQPVANTIKTGAFIARTSNFEAGMEARHNFYDAMEKYHMDFEEIHGRVPSMEEIKDFTDLARRSANGVYAGNMAILSVSNVAMFGKTFGIDPFNMGQRINRSANKLIGLSPTVSKTGETVLKEATKLQKFSGRAYNFLSKPVIEGLYEEGMQGVAGETMQHYLESKYNPDFADSYGFTAALADGFAETYGTKEGWKEIGIGMIIGMIAPALQGQGLSGFGKASYKSKRAEVEKAVTEANAAQQRFQENIIAGMNNADAAVAFRERSLRRQQEAQEQGTMAKNDDIDMAVVTAQYFKSQSRFKTHSEIESEFEAIINKTELAEDVKEALRADGISESDYKSAIIENFKNTGQDYLQAKKAVERLGLDGRVKFDKATMAALESLTPGAKKANVGLIADYLITSFVVGSAARRSGKEIGKDIEALTGKDGLADAMAFYTALANKRGSKLMELDKKRNELNEKKDLFQEVGVKMSRLSGQRTQGETATDFANEYNATAEQHTTLTNQILELEKEIENLEASTKDEYQSVAMSAGIAEIEGIGEFLSPTDFLQQIKDLDNYIAQLRENGESQKADVLEYQLQQYKEQMDAAREMDNLALAIADANFFASKRGQGLIGSIIGTRYEMPEDLKKAIDENNDLFDEELRRGGKNIEGKTTSEIVEQLINESENLSERDKHKLSAILRLELDVRQRVQTAQERLALREEAATEVVTETPTEGDTLFPSDSVRTAVRKIIDQEGESTLDRYNQLIDELLSAVDQLRGESRTEKRTKLQEQIKTLQEKKAELEEKLKKEQAQQPKDTDTDVDTTTSTTQTELDAVNQEVERLNEELSQNQAVRIIETADHKRLDELNKKRANEELTFEEQNESAQLEEDIDRWIDITGTVVYGYRLSDLLRLRAQLEATEVQSPEDVAIANALKILETVDFNTRSKDSFYDLGQSYDAVTAIGLEKDGKSYVSIQGMTLEQLTNEISFEPEQSTNLFPAEEKRGNIVLSQEQIERINSETRLRILPSIGNLKTNYSVVVRLDSKGNGRVVTSTFATKSFNEEMKPREAYQAKKGDPVELKVDPKDAFNQELIEEYNRAEDKAKALQEIKDRMVIKIMHNGNFVGVLKGKTDVRTKSDLEFAAMRSQIVDNAEFLEEFLSGKQELSLDLPVTVKQVLPGFPNFRIKGEPGNPNVTIESTVFTPQLAKKVSDIGYIERVDKEPKITTRSGDYQGVNMTFTDKIAKNLPKGRKLPIIVFTFQGQKYAYPVELQQMETPDNTEMKTVFDSDLMTPIQKVIRLNEILADRGVDIKESGNAFTPQNIESSEFFDNMFARVENIEYFSDLEKWAGSNKDNRSVEDILMSEAFIDIDLSNPLHSPKLSLDYSQVEITIPEQMQKDYEKQRKTKQKSESTFKNKNLDKLRNKKDDNTCN